MRRIFLRSLIYTSIFSLTSRVAIYFYLLFSALWFLRWAGHQPLATDLKTLGEYCQDLVIFKFLLRLDSSLLTQIWDQIFIADNVPSLTAIYFRIFHVYFKSTTSAVLLSVSNENSALFSNLGCGLGHGCGRDLGEIVVMVSRFRWWLRILQMGLLRLTKSHIGLLSGELQKKKRRKNSGYNKWLLMVFLILLNLHLRQLLVQLLLQHLF